MEIGCTKTLRTKLRITAQAPSESNEVFCWSANLLTIKRRQVVVVVNNSSRFSMVLYGLKAKDFARLPALILEEMRVSLAKQGLNLQAIEQYMRSAGPVSLTPTNSARAVARMNKVCELVKFYEYCLGNDMQHKLIQRLNYDLISINKKDYAYPAELLLRDFEQFSSGPVICWPAAELLLKLDLGKQKAWRLIITPTQITFRQLHDMIQVLYNWQDEHLYDFTIPVIPDQSYLFATCIVDGSIEDSPERQVVMDTDIVLADHLKIGSTISYHYDYGDSWEISIEVHKIIGDYDLNYAVCLKGEGNAPPDDVGGVSGYKRFLKIIADPDHEDYRYMTQWAAMQDYRDFDLDDVNLRLKYM